MPSESDVFDRIDEVIEPFSNYRKAIKDLSQLPPGYAMCFAAHYVHADICNGGISQLYANSTWPLILSAISAAEETKNTNVARTLKEIVFYYHKAGRSKLKRQINDEFFEELPADWDKSLQQLEDEYFDIESAVTKIIPGLCKQVALFE